ncbi:MAG: GspH/FimT family pseudopilin [Burkholderiales bacterium]
MLIYPKLPHGFTLIELMITVTVIGVLLVAGYPEMSTWLQNTKIRSYAETISNGIQLARAEAVRRNTQVQFVLTSTLPIAANTPALVASASGPYWVVRKWDSTNTYDPADPINAPWFIQGGGTEVTTSSAVVNATAANFRFNGLGRTNIGAANVTIQVTNPTAGACVAASGPMRCLNVVVQTGGQIRMCDPSIPVASGDTRAC